MAIEYRTYSEIPAEHKNRKGFLASIPMDAAGNPYQLYEYDADEIEANQYCGLYPRAIAKLNMT